MKKIIPEFFPCWPYAEALTWMSNAYDRVAENENLIILGYGSHASKIITLGRSSSQQDINSYLKISDTSIFLTDRGGGPTAHEPGQLVLYPVLNLHNLKLSIRDLVHRTELTMLNFMAYLGVRGNLSELSHGVFIGESKIGFIGMRIKNNITAHGMAINLFNKTELFKTFSPCNISNLRVGSLCDYINLSQSLGFYGEKLCEYFILSLEKNIK